MATNIWKELPESGGGAGTITDINGATGPSITIDAGAGIDVTTVGDTITITNTGSNPTGTPDTFAGFDGFGNLESVPGFSIDGTSGGMNESLLEQPNNVGGGYNANNFNVAFQPLQNSPDDDWNIQLINVNFDNTASGFSQGTNGEAATFLNLSANHGGTGSIGTVNFIKSFMGMGNGTDPFTIKGYSLFLGFGDISDNITIDGQLQGFTFQPHVHSGALSTNNFNVSVFTDAAQIEIPVNSYTSANLGPQINAINNNSSYNGVTVNPIIPTLSGNAAVTGYGFYPTITTVGATGNINILNSNPTITTMGASSSFNGINMGGLITTMGASSNIIGMYITPVITTSHGSIQGININPQVNGGDANVTGISINVSGTATGLQNIRGLSIQLNNVPTTDSSGPIALETDSRLSVNAGTTPQSAQAINIGTRIEHLFQIPSGSPLTGTDLLGLDLAGDLLAQDDMAVGPIGIGFSSVGFIADMAVAVGKTVDLIHVFLPAVALPDPGFTTGGTVTTMEFIHLQAPLTQGGTITTTNLYGMRIVSDFSTTTSPTNAWGISIEDPAVKNHLAGNIDVGSLSLNGSTSGALTLNASAVTTSYSVIMPAAQGTGALINDGAGNLSWTSVSSGANTALSNLASTAVNTDILPDTDLSHGLGSFANKWNNVYTGNLILNNGNATTTISPNSSGAASYTLILPDDQASAPGDYMSNDGAGNLSWSPVPANTTLSNLVAPTSINVNFIPSGDLTRTLGSSTRRWTAALGTIIDGVNQTVIDITNKNLKRSGTTVFSWNTAGSLDASTNKIVNVVNPTAAQDAATKNYVDTKVSVIPTNTVNTTYVVVSTDNVIFADTSGGAFNITLPSPTAGRQVSFKDSTGSFLLNNLTVLPSGAETIDGAASLVMNINYQSSILISDGINWFIL